MIGPQITLISEFLGLTSRSRLTFLKYMNTHLKTTPKNKSKKAETVPHVYEDKVGLERIMFFSDAVMAIAITLLALEIRLPGEGVANLNDSELLHALLGIMNQYLGYIVSFLVIGMYWISHHNNFRLINRYDRHLMTINLLFLLVVAFIPFPTRILSENGNTVSTIFYAANLAAVGLLAYWMLSYAAGGHRLLDPGVRKATIRHLQRINLLSSAIFLLSIGLAFLDNGLARLSWLLILFISLLRG